MHGNFHFSLAFPRLSTSMLRNPISEQVCWISFSLRFCECIRESSKTARHQSIAVSNISIGQIVAVSPTHGGGDQ